MKYMSHKTSDKRKNSLLSHETPQQNLQGRQSLLRPNFWGKRQFSRGTTISQERMNRLRGSQFSRNQLTWWNRKLLAKIRRETKTKVLTRKKNLVTAKGILARKETVRCSSSRENLTTTATVLAAWSGVPAKRMMFARHSRMVFSRDHLKISQDLIQISRDLAPWNLQNNNSHIKFNREVTPRFRKQDLEVPVHHTMPRDPAKTQGWLNTNLKEQRIPS